MIPELNSYTSLSAPSEITSLQADQEPEGHSIKRKSAQEVPGGAPKQARQAGALFHARVARHSSRLSAINLPETIIECTAYFTGLAGIESLGKVNKEWNQFIYKRPKKNPYILLPTSFAITVRVVDFMRHSKQKPFTWNAYQELSKIESHFNPESNGPYSSLHIHHFRLKKPDSAHKGNLAWLPRAMPKLQSLDFTGCTDRQVRFDTFNEINRLSLLTRLNLRGLCIHEEWLKSFQLTNSLPLLQTLILPWAGDQHLSYLTCFKNLRKICVDHSAISDGGLDHLASLPLETISMGSNAAGVLTHFSGFSRLRKLNLGECPVNSVTFAQLQYCCELEELTFAHLCSQIDIGDWDLTHLTFPKLKRLNMPECKNITHEGIVFLAASTALQELNFSGYYRLTDQALPLIMPLKDLRSLDLTYCTLLTDQGIVTLLDPISGLNKLEKLVLIHCNEITDVALHAIERLTTLRHLDLTSCKHITDAGLSVFENFTQLETLRFLRLHNCPLITDRGIFHLKGMHALQELDIGRCPQVSDEGVQYLSILSRLSSLNLLGAGITNACSPVLAAFSSLRSLDLSECRQITDEILVALMGLNRLENLDLRGCDISDNGLAYLRAITTLEQLHIVCRKITIIGIKSLGHFQRLRFLQIPDHDVDQSTLDHLKVNLNINGPVDIVTSRIWD